MPVGPQLLTRASQQSNRDQAVGAALPATVADMEEGQNGIGGRRRPPDAAS